MDPNDPVPLSSEELDALEREALLAVVARGDCRRRRRAHVPHERVRAWLLDWAAGGDAPRAAIDGPD
jgi:hypothetical protein